MLVYFGLAVTGAELRGSTLVPPLLEHIFLFSMLSLLVSPVNDANLHSGPLNDVN